MNTAVRRTLVALVASGLGAIPLCQVFTDRGWLLDVWLSMAIVVGPAAFLRLRRPPGALQVWPGLALLVLWLVAAFVPAGAWFGFVPSGATVRQVGGLLTELHASTAHQIAPVPTTLASRLVLCTLLGLLAALIDLLAVVGRRGVLAGVPLLVVFTVAGALSRHGVSWIWFVAPAIALLMLLALDARDTVAGWGHRVRRQGERAGRRPLDLAAQRIGVLAVAAAVVLPVVIPVASTDLLPGLFRHSGGGGSDGLGVGGTIDPWVALRGQLLRPQTLPLAGVQVSDLSGGQPFYLRTNVLSTFTGDGWVEASHGVTQPLDTTGYDTLPAPASSIVSPGPGQRLRYEARIQITGMRGNAPVFAVPTVITGLPGVSWSPQDQLLLGAAVREGTTFTEDVAQPQPTQQELEQARLPAGLDMRRWLSLPSIRSQVQALVRQIVGGRTAPYDIARAINDFFTDPANGFSYSLQTKAGDSGNDLVDFLHNRVGFCQQYAAAMGVMLRLAGVPARVVLGYTHPVPIDGSFQVTTDDAHSWVEAYLGDIGWVAFDPTPLAGIAGGRSNDLPWAPHGGAGVTGSAGATASASARPSHSAGRSSSAAAPAAQPATPAGGPPLHRWLPVAILAALVAIGLTPWFVRTARRRARLRRDGDCEALWSELRDTAVDLGYVWSPARSPRQVVRWLREPVGDAITRLRGLALALERQRYAAATTADPAGPDGAWDVLRADLVAVRSRLMADTSRSVRLRARFLPSSLGWRLGRRRH
ncbi:MAG: hypothetical protein EPN43_07030 [Jatrophihabitans sp.]|nr:MAG: hypothetical protein EPN43_07030 [Jatrophihabitans sp.]